MPNQSKEDHTWRELCAMTDTLFPKYGSRAEAFKAACRLRPDLASVAAAPDGRRDVRGLTGPLAATPLRTPTTAFADLLARAGERLRDSGYLCVIKS